MVADYRIRIRRGEFELELESSDKAFVEHKLKEMLESQFRKKEGEDDQPEVAGSGGKAQSLTEFVDMVSPSADTEFATACVFFLEEYQHKSGIKTKDIAKCFGNIKFKCSNVSDAVARAKTRKFLMDSSAPRTVEVSRTGQEWVKARLAKNAKAD